MLLDGVDRGLTTETAAVHPRPSILRRAWAILCSEGWLALWFRVLGETVYRRLLLVELDLPPRLAAPEGMTARWLRSGEAPAYAEFHPALTVDEVRRRLAIGERCLVLEDGGRIVHGRWVAHKRAWIEYLRVALPLSSGSVYLYQSYTPPALRGQGYATAGAAAAGHILCREGFERVLGCIQPDRSIAYPPAFKLGYRPVGYIGWYRLGHWRIPFRTTARRFPWYAPPVRTNATAYWDSIAPQEGSRYLDWFLARLKRREHLALIERWGGIPQYGRVLKTDLFEEANSADRLLDTFRRPHNSVFGIDLSPKITASAARRVQARGICAATDVRRLPFAAETFDLIVSPSTLDHFADAADLGRSLRELHRTLRAGGRLIVTLDNRGNLTDPLLRLASMLRLTPYYLGRSSTSAGLRRELEAAGFRVIDTDWILHAPRLVPVAAVKLAQVLGSPRFERWVHRSLLRAQALRNSRLRELTGAFVAALAERTRS